MDKEENAKEFVSTDSDTSWCLVFKKNVLTNIIEGTYFKASLKICTSCVCSVFRLGKSNTSPSVLQCDCHCKDVIIEVLV